ncbi:MAG: hypothetical protein ACRD8U_21105, partial [Pyrinomonadaceae bacterium]
SVILKRGQNVKYLPYAFTEQGVAMLSSVLHSDRAAMVNVEIMRLRAPAGAPRDSRRSCPQARGRTPVAYADAANAYPSRVALDGHLR